MPAWLTVVVAALSALGGGGISALLRARAHAGRDRASTEVILQEATAAAIANVRLAAEQAQASASQARDEANAAHADAERSRLLAQESTTAAVVAQGRVRYLEEEVAQARVHIARLQEQLSEMSTQMELERRTFQRRLADEAALLARRNGIT